MPKAPAKKMTKAKKSIKMKASPRAKAVKAKKAAPKKRGFMWKALEQLQANRKKLESPVGPMRAANPNQRFNSHPHSEGFSRFNGPRRRAG